MPIVEYRPRNSRDELSDVFWRAHEDKLERISVNGAVLSAIPYKRVRRVRLAFDTGRGRTTRFLMELNGRKTRKLAPSIAYDASGSIDEHESDYFPLVRQIVAGVKTANPKAEFLEGDDPGLYGLLIGVNLVIVALLVAVVLSVPILPGKAELAALVKAVLIVFSVGLLLAWGIESRPRHFRRWRDLDRFLSARSD
jgi:hypothetical protein